ncbi:MAG: DUF4278 domain-containing protein [Limnothrix sp. RL_2_0]|nr:DUF4278 domain-containing protein [Limnothrix sp. RL_2_0]
MKFSYRGVQYDSTPGVVEAVEGKTIGKYRGSENHVHAPKQRIKVVHHTNLKYRGAEY